MFDGFGQFGGKSHNENREQVKGCETITMQSRTKMIGYLLLDCFATLLPAAFTWFCAWFYYKDFRPPDLSGIPHSIPQLQRQISYISLWCMGLAFAAAAVNFIVVRRMGRALNFEASASKKFAIWSALVHWLFIFLPTLWFAYNFWMLHTTYISPYDVPTATQRPAP